MRSGITGMVVLACAALVGLLAYGLASNGVDDSIDQSLADGRRPAAPLAELPRLGSAGTGSLAAYKGKVVVLNFWANWCPPCRKEMPLLQRTHERIAARGGLVLGIDSKDTTEAAMAFLRKHDIHFPSLRDHGDYSRRYGLTGYPETFIVDRSGRIAAARRAQVTEEWLRRNLDPVLAE